MSDAKITIRRATHADLPFLVAAGKRETETIGFLPGQALLEYVVGRNVLIATIGGERVGYLLFRLSEGRRPSHQVLPTGRHLKVIQICVDPRFRRRGVGRALVVHLGRIAARKKADCVTCWVARDLGPASEFWTSLGFDYIGCRYGGKRRKRVHLGLANLMLSFERVGHINFKALPKEAFIP